MPDYKLGKIPGSPRWYIIWTEGRRSFRVSTRTTDKSQADLVLAAFRLERERKAEADPDEFAIVDVLQRYYEEHAAKLASAQQAAIAIRYLTDFYGTSRVSAINQVSHLQYEMQRRDQGAAWQYINRERMVLRAALNHCRKYHGLKTVPFIPTIPAHHPANRPSEPRGRPLTLAEVAKLLKAARSPHMRLYLLILIGTMCRPDAARDLTMAQVDFDHGLIDLNPPGRPQTKKYRPTVPLPQFLRRALRKIKGGHVLQYHGAPIARIKTAWRALREAAGLDAKVNAYSIRHTMARELRRRKVPGDEISIMLGHRPPEASRTDLIYAPYEPGYCRTAARTIDAIYREIARKLRASADRSGSRKGVKCLK